MNKEIQNIIEKTWPSQTAGVIRKTILEMENTIKEQISAVQILDAAKNISLVNKKRKISLDDEARNLRCTVMEKELSMLRENMGVIQALVGQVFSHPSTTWDKSKK